MLVRDQLIKEILSRSPGNFEQLALKVFNYQSKYNLLYNRYLKLLNIIPKSIQKIEEIPFLPIQFFKSHDVKTGNWVPETVFLSSGTTGTISSKHLVKDLQFYLQNTVRGFEMFYGAVNNYAIFALLPSYLERDGSSLVHMANHFIQQSGYEQSGFYLKKYETLLNNILSCKSQNIPVLLIGVSFALLDLAEQFPTDLSGIILMETGGMKGRRKEITKHELHKKLSYSFHISKIHSEYGMTELFSQAYSTGNGIYKPSPTMRVLIRDITDPFHYLNNRKTGALNIIDLLNIDSCSFVATDDLGKSYKNGNFEILGRLDQSDIRGCNLLVANS